MNYTVHGTRQARLLEWVALFPRRRQWHPTPVLLPGKSHGQTSLEGCSPWGRWGSDRTDFTFTFHFHALEKEMATHSSVLAWRIPGMWEPSGLLSMGLHRVGHDWSNLAAAAAAFLFCKGSSQSRDWTHVYRAHLNWQPTKKLLFQTYHKALGYSTNNSDLRRGFFQRASRLESSSADNWTLAFFDLISREPSQLHQIYALNIVR